MLSRSAATLKKEKECNPWKFYAKIESIFWVFRIWERQLREFLEFLFLSAAGVNTKSLLLSKPILSSKSDTLRKISDIHSAVIWSSIPALRCFRLRASGGLPGSTRTWETRTSCWTATRTCLQRTSAKSWKAGKTNISGWSLTLFSPAKRETAG